MAISIPYPEVSTLVFVDNPRVGIIILIYAVDLLEETNQRFQGNLLLHNMFKHRKRLALSSRLENYTSSLGCLYTL